MALPYVGEIRMFAGNFAPDGWLMCDGREYGIGEYETLFQLIGNTYGGAPDGPAFGVPDLRGRIPIHQGNGHTLGEAAGVEEVTLTVAQIPQHSHAFETVPVQGDQISPAGNVPAESFNVVPYINDPPTGEFDEAALAPTGGSQPHTNFQPYLCVNFIISTAGIFPSPT